MSAAWRWAWSRVRSRWVTLAVVALVISMAGGAMLAAIAGARRSASTYDRHLVATDGPDAAVSTFFGPEWWVPGVLDPLLENELVESWTEVVMMAMRPVGSDALFIFDRPAYAAVDDRFGTELSRFRMVEGRAFDHRRADEAVVNEEYADFAGVGVGDVIRFESWADETVNWAATKGNFVIGPPDGPVVDVTVVGVARELQQLLPTSAAAAYLPAAFTRAWRGQIGDSAPVGLVSLEGGREAFPSFEAAVQAANQRLGTGAFLTDEWTATRAEVGGPIDTQVLALVVFAVVAAAVGLVVTSATLSRQLSSAGADQGALRALGMTRASRTTGVTIIGLPVALVAAVASAASALAVSGFLPIGTPGRIEPDRGIHADLPVLLVGGLVIGLCVVLGSILVGTSVTGRRFGVARASRTTRPRLVRVLSASAPVSFGTRLALEKGRGARAMPTRLTLAGIVVGLVGVSASLAFYASLQKLESDPRVHGRAADAWVAAGGGVDEWQSLARRLEAEPAVDGLATVINTDLTIEGEGVSAIIFDPRRGDPINVMVAGRAPQAADEMVVGAAVADGLDIGPGDVVSVALTDGSAAPFQVVGIAAHHLESGEAYRDQVAVLGSSRQRFLSFDDGPWFGAAVSFRDGAEGDALLAQLADEGYVVASLTAAGPPGPVANLAEVERFPLALAGLLGALALASLLHALAVASRRRGRELAVLRVLGFSSRQLRTVSVSQATTLALMALALGLPIGISLGRTAWRAVTTDLGVVTAHRLPTSPPLWVLAMLLTASVAGLAVGQWTGRTRPAAQLSGVGRE